MNPSLAMIFAHPDDETFFAAGTIARCVEAGARVSLLCATRGERGATGDRCSIPELPFVRELELRDAARVLGIHEVEFLDYEDQKLAQAPEDEARRSIVAFLRRVRPEVVLTFDPEGANRHPDHIAISRFAMGAVAEADTVQRVLWPGTARVWELGVSPGLAAEPGIDYLIDIRSKRAVKEAALRAHGTQWPGLSRLFLGNPTAMDWECFRTGWGRRPATIPAGEIL